MPDRNYDEGEEAGDCLVERCSYCGELPENCTCNCEDKWD